MAENETLDLQRSPRWNQARRFLRDNAPPAEMAEEICRCCERTIVQVAKLIPLAVLIEEARNPWGAPRQFLDQCGRAWDYANMVLEIMGRVREPKAVLLEILCRIANKFFDQERQGLDFSGDGSSFRFFERRRHEVFLGVLPRLEEVARRQAGLICGDQGRPQRLRAPRELQEQILHQSLLL